MLPGWDKPQFPLLLTSNAEEEMEKSNIILQRTLHWKKPFSPLRAQKEARLHLLEAELHFLNTSIGFAVNKRWLNPPTAGIILLVPQHRPNYQI